MSKRRNKDNTMSDEHMIPVVCESEQKTKKDWLRYTRSCLCGHWNPRECECGGKCDCHRAVQQ